MENVSATTAGSANSEPKLSGSSIAPGLGMGSAWLVGDVLWARQATKRRLK